MEILIILAVLTFLYGIGFLITGALLSAACWIFVRLPLALFFFGLGLSLCATLLLIPLGLKCFGLAGDIHF